MRQAIDVEIASLIARHGDHAFEVAYSRAREFVQTEEDRRFNQAVRRELARRLGIEYGLDTATRYLTGEVPDRSSRAKINLSKLLRRS